MAPVPVKIRGGPDEYTLQNLTGRRLLDVAVIPRPTRATASAGSTSCRPPPPRNGRSRRQGLEDATKKKKDASKKQDRREEDARGEGPGRLRGGGGQG